MRVVSVCGRGVRRGLVAWVVTGCVLATGVTGASADRAAAKPTPTTVAATGPVADLSEELTGGNGAFIGRLGDDDLGPARYVEHEYVAAGTASSYTPTQALTADGRWSVAPSGSAPYRTRVLVRRPKNPADFSGTVIVEWLNVSPGVDNEPTWANAHEEITRAGHVWVGVSAQTIGIEGGPVAVKVEGIPGAEVAGQGLKRLDPARYGSLSHPGDAYSLDIFSQVTRAVANGEGLDGLVPEHLIGSGQSQSAAAMTTYINAIQPMDELFDGFFLQSRFSVGLPIFTGATSTGLADAIGGTATIIRTDLGKPVFVLQTENDVTSVVNSYAVRQPDTDAFRLWEVAGTAHADVHQMGEANAAAMHCGLPVNDGPMHVVNKAALRALTEWVADGTMPPTAPLLDVSADRTVQRDADGVALGGVRTPPVDVPVEALSGERGPNPSTICLLLGSTAPFTDARIAELYRSKADYLKRYKASVTQAIKAGWVLPQDRTALLAYARPERIAG